MTAPNEPSGPLTGVSTYDRGSQEVCGRAPAFLGTSGSTRGCAPRQPGRIDAECDERLPMERLTRSFGGFRIRALNPPRGSPVPPKPAMPSTPGRGRVLARGSDDVVPTLVAL